MMYYYLISSSVDVFDVRTQDSTMGNFGIAKLAS